MEDSNELSYYMFSGSIDANKFSSNMFAIKPYSVSFSSTSVYPEDRSYYGMFYSTEYYDGYLYNRAVVFGGIGSDGVLGDFWAYYMDEDSWEIFDLKLPEPSYDFAYATEFDSVTNSSIVYVLGGINNINEYISKLYV